MTEKELIERIDKMSYRDLSNMSYPSMAMLTGDYQESLVRRVVGRGKTILEQMHLRNRINSSYEFNVNEGNVRYDPQTPQLLTSLQFDLECGIPIKNENVTVLPSDEKEVKPAADFENRIKELEEENKRLSEENKERINQLKAEIDNLNNSLEAFKTQDGKNRMTARQAALFIQTVCHNLGGLPNDKKTLSPILQWGWGFTEHTSQRALGGKAEKSETEKLAQLFDDISPKLARLIREFPETFNQIKKKKLKDNNDKRLKIVKRESK